MSHDSFAVVELHPVTAIQSSLSQFGSANMASSVRENNFGAANCIDGDTDGPDGSLTTGGYTLCSTDKEPCPWLAIDYGKTVTVKRVEIFNRMGSCCGNRTRNVDVRISDELPASASQMFSGGALLGHFAGPGTHGQHITISGQTFKLSLLMNILGQSEMSGRYVIVQMDNDVDQLNLKEVIAFGMCGPH